MLFSKVISESGRVHIASMPLFRHIETSFNGDLHYSNGRQSLSFFLCIVLFKAFHDSLTVAMSSFLLKHPLSWTYRHHTNNAFGWKRLARESIGRAFVTYAAKQSKASLTRLFGRQYRERLPNHLSGPQVQEHILLSPVP